MAVTDYSTTPASNTSVSGIDISENCAPAGINDAIRQVMADIKTFYDLVPQGVIGTDIQAYHANLASLSGLTFAADKGLYTTGANTAALFDLSAAGRALIANSSPGTQRITLGLGTAATVDVIDEDSFATNSATRPPSQQSVKAYVDTEVGNTLAPVSLGNFSGVTTITAEVNRGVACTVTRISAGRYQCVLASSYADKTVVAMAGNSTLSRVAAQVVEDSATQFTIYVINHGNGAFSDAEYVSYAVFE